MMLQIDWQNNEFPLSCSLVGGIYPKLYQIYHLSVNRI